MIPPFDSDLEPVIDKYIFDRILKDKQWQEMEIARCSYEPWYFLVNYCWTIRRDETGSFVERVPAKEYLRQIATDWLENPFYILTKSRQMLATWFMIGLHLWKAMFNPNIHVCCQTKKEEDADSEMIKRAEFIWTNMAIWFRKFAPRKVSYCKFLLPKTDGILRGIPAGGDQIRSHNPNYLLTDEFAFQPEAEESYTAALPCCQRITVVTSANPGFCCDLVHNRIRMAG